ncbi:MAG: DJ-1/PfpI family protein, partial [Ferruginibacter sp.]
CLPGGRAPDYLRLTSKVIDCAKYFSDTSKPIAATFHRIQILIAANVVKGRKITAYYAVDNVAATETVVGGNLITSPASPGNSK